jgi:hypothetical protein
MPDARLFPRWEYHYVCGNRRSPRRVNWNNRMLAVALDVIPRTLARMMDGRY